MRISDWSSDVCSSDLRYLVLCIDDIRYFSPHPSVRKHLARQLSCGNENFQTAAQITPPHIGSGTPVVPGKLIGRPRSVLTAMSAQTCRSRPSPFRPDRKTIVEGKRVSSR